MSEHTIKVDVQRVAQDILTLHHLIDKTNERLCHLEEHLEQAIMQGSIDQMRAKEEGEDDVTKSVNW